MTVGCREAAAELTGMYSRRVTESFTRQEALETWGFTADSLNKRHYS